MLRCDPNSRAIAGLTTRPWTIMEVCGGQTHAIVKFGIDELLPKEITLMHGPGYPVCETPLELIDKAIDIASRPGVIFCSFGDRLRVPGSRCDLLTVKANGGDVRIVYSPMDAVKLAREQPGKQVVFLPSVSRPPPRPRPWRPIGRGTRDCATFPCLSRTFWSRRPWKRSLRPPHGGHSLPARNELGESRREAHPEKGTSSLQPAPPLQGGEGEHCPLSL